MIKPEKLKPFLLHEDADVRNTVGKYFYEGHIQDPEILPLTIQACDRYGHDGCALLLFHAQRQILDDNSADKLLDALISTDNENVQMHLTSLLSNASIEFLRTHLESMKNHGDSRYWQMAGNRIAFCERSAQELWQTLKDYAEQCKTSRMDASYSIPLIELLGEYDYPKADHICELLEDSEIYGQWLEVFLIQLAAARKIERTIPILNAGLVDDNFGITDVCTKALCQIGTETVVETLKNGITDCDWGYQLSASSILGNIKLPASEEAILDILENHSKSLPHDIYCTLCFSLCDLFSNKAFHYGKKVIDDIEAIQIDSMRKQLLTLSVILGTPLAEATQKRWKKEMASESRRLREHRRKHNPALFKLGELFRQRLGVEADGDAQEYLVDHEEAIEDSGHINDRPVKTKPGRNEPCHCKSGKKFKKCCGKKA